MIIITLMACALLAVVITFIVKAITKVIGHLDEVADGKMVLKSVKSFYKEVMKLVILRCQSIP